ncbi:ribosomal-protein-alanine N-acetyltransferase [Paenibacillus taihuensis]|uniref:Ribosomal-protein-alanine N-acetyltransferase n=1 Tax=Paenibacillus taihuensis TaxID=1156355 RepID=A0A3D9RR80_9BACL|nr:GNAT family N-acetyltransferase [Paenibacillus taihuensis]REE78925.1 ribosomal-protein-alanine N-acetyltransferase [Paenibacillus taihuensis]
MFPVLETERLRLREITEADAAEVFACFSNREVTQYYGQEPFESEEQAARLIGLFASNYENKRGIRWGIERKGSPGLMGTIGFNALVLPHRRAEIGYELHPAYWGSGYASEAVKRVITYGFENLGLARIGAVVFPENAPSISLLTRLGFQQEGVLRDYMVQGGRSHATNVYSMVRAECSV